MDQLPTRLVNVHVDLLDGIPPIPSLVREFESVPGNVGNHFILGGMQPRPRATVVRSAGWDRYDGHRRIEQYADWASGLPARCDVANPASLGWWVGDAAAAPFAG